MGGWATGFRILDSEYSAACRVLRYRVWGCRFRVKDSGFGVEDLELKVWVRVQSSGFGHLHIVHVRQKLGVLLQLSPE
jgi:hypothetical protein